ncbi:hypothetical protein BLNAU_10660 [Blattamonas nauphoetae]|uniref:Uncharacterized protein n=1 Tax=Blattamonas nauphoetae TaxID=2049346 RepID=A0ABQ9XPI6_9EUKA|nr:hypothetical protein BLNAU_10660 [Blattamonas nauphoetae]
MCPKTSDEKEVEGEVLAEWSTKRAPPFPVAGQDTNDVSEIVRVPEVTTATGSGPPSPFDEHDENKEG